MTQFTLINPAACVEIGRTDFLAADLTERAARRSSAAAERIQAQRDLQDAERAFIASRECEHDADRAEADNHISTAEHAAVLVSAFLRQMEQNLSPTIREGLASDDADFADVIAEAIAERFTDKALARVFLASVKLGVC